MEPAPPRARDIRPPGVRWGIGDVVAAWLAGLLASIVASAFVLDARKPVQLLVLLLAQDVTVIVWLALVARWKGRGSLEADFGFRFVTRGKQWFTSIPWVFAGLGLQLVALVPTALLVAIHGEEARQDVVKVADQSTGFEIPLIVLAVALLAPITEELLFRGALLRSLQRRMGPGTAVLVSATVFAAIHAVGDPSIGSLVALPAIMLLGVVSGHQAVKTGDLTRSIMLHVGFNSLSALLLFTA